VRGRITILAPAERNFVVVDAPLPAGLEAINFNLETSDQGLLSEIENSDNHFYWWNNLWYFNHREVRDDRLLLFADYLPDGKYEYQFLARAITKGEFQVAPVNAAEMYQPETFGRSRGEIFRVK
jgi:hypothetical protein